MNSHFKTCFIIVLLGLFIHPVISQCTFSFSPQNPCPGQTVTFTVINPMSGATYKWNLDNGTQFNDGTGTTVTFIYPYAASAINYTIKLEKDAVACPMTQSIMVKAGQLPTIGVVSGGTISGNTIAACNNSPTVMLKINNTSLPTNNPPFTSYTIDWDDGSPLENFTNATFNSMTAILHVYSGPGYKYLKLTATYNNGCVFEQIYNFFNGGNPNIGLSSIGNTNGLCAPTTLTFNVKDYQQNPPGTTYQFYINDKITGPQFIQENLKDTFNFDQLFDATSCGEKTPDGQYDNSFSIKIVAKNPCGEKTANVQPITLSTKPIPDFSIQGPTNYCPNQVFTFTNTTKNIHEFNTLTYKCLDTLNANWEITPSDYAFVSGGLFNYNQIKIKFLKPGTYTIKMTINPDPSCGPAMITKTITVLEPPVAAATTDPSAPNGCAPRTVKFINQSMGYQISYNWHISPSTGWSWQPGGGNGDVTTAEPTALFIKPGSYEVTLTVTNVCSSSTWKTTIIIKDKPNVTLPFLGPFCQSAILDFSGVNTPVYADNSSPITKYLWSFPGGTPGTSNLQVPPNINYSPVPAATTLTYSISITNECGTNIVSGTFDIQVPEIIKLPSDTSVCKNSPSFQIIANPGGGKWTGNGVSMSGIFDPTNSGGPGLKTLTYSYGAQGSPCTTMKSMNITVLDLPIVNAGIDLKKCEYDPVFSLNGTPGGGNWTPNPTTLGLAGNTFDPSKAIPGNYTLTYNYKDAINGCTNSDQMVLTINNTPKITTNDTSYCKTSGLVLLPKALPTGGTWNGPGVTGNMFDPQTPGGPNFKVTYTYTDPQTMCFNAKDITINVSDPANVDAGSDKVFCKNDMPFDLNSDAVPSSGGFWSGPGVSGNIFTPMNSGVGTHIISLKTGFGNCAVNDIRIFKVNEIPLIDLPMSLTSCESDSNVILPDAIPASSGVWTSNPAGLVKGNIFNAVAAGEGSFTLILTVSDMQTSCKNADSSIMTVKPLPKISTNDTTYCNTQGEVLLPYANPKGGTWSGKGVTGLMFDPYISGIGDHSVTYHFSDPNGCSDSAISIIHVIDPMPVIAGPKDTICKNGGLLQLSNFSPSKGGHWSGNGIVNDTTGIFDPIKAAIGLNLIVYSFGAGNCQLYDTTIIFVIGINVDAGPDTSVCLDNTPLSLSNFIPSTGGTWSGKGITSTSGIFDPGVAGVGTHELTYKIIDALLGCSFEDKLTITVHPMPKSNFPKPNSACKDEEIQFDNLSDSTYKVKWDFGDGQTSILSKPMHTYTDTGSYTIKLTSTNEFGCTDMHSETIFVIEPPHAFFTSMPDSGCAVLPVSFQNESYGWQTKYLWQSGSLKIDSIFNPKQIFLPGGTKDTFYTITLTATNLCAAKTWTDSILVHPLPIVDLGNSTDTICNGEFIKFTNNTLGQPETFKWDFGNGKTSTVILPDSLQYFTDTLFHTYTVQLIATNFCGSDTAQRLITVKPADVRAFFNVPNLIGCQPYTVNFINKATPGAFVSWQFGDSYTSSEFNPSHTFKDAGTFKVIQKASDGCGYDSTLAYITVLPAPKVSFASVPQLCMNDSIFFQNTSQDSLTNTKWDFGDGNSSTSVDSIVLHIYNSIGIKTVVLTEKFPLTGCEGHFTLPVKVLDLPFVNFAPVKYDGCMPLVDSFLNFSKGANYFEWDFGDGNTSNDTVPVHTFDAANKYTIKLNGVDLNGCRNDTIFNYITVYPIPTPSFEIERDHLCGLPVQAIFSNNTPDAISYEWIFGDGSNPDPDNNPKHNYSDPGNFQVILFAENTYGCHDTSLQFFSAYAQPIANFSWDPEKGCTPLNVVFENLSTNYTNAMWIFSDGGLSDSLSKTNYTFYDGGKYGATLIANNLDVCFDTLSLEKIITAYPSPTANFSYNEVATSPSSGMFEFTDLSLGAMQWKWDFGDGDSSSLQNPDHRYYSNGAKEVKLTIWGINDCQDDTILIITPTFIHGLFIPNAFTPSLSNGKAATFFPAGVGLKEYEIAVYSSYGQLLWSSEELNNGQPVGFWDGIYKGELMPQDVYTWQVKKAIFDDGSSWDGKRVGSVTLIR